MIKVKILRSKVARNAVWIISGKIIQALLGLVISLLTARFLGTSNFGLINYASSLVGFVTPLAFLGLNNTLVQELTNNPESEGEILGSSILVSLVSAIACIIGIAAFVCLANKGETVTLIVCFLYSLILIFQVLDLIRYWFQTKLLSKYSAIITLTSYLIVSTYKIFLLATKKSIYWFSLSSVFDVCFISLGLLVAYKRLGGSKFSFSFKMIKTLLEKSRLYIVTGMMVAIFAQTDKIMLKTMIDDSSTGLYSAAVACAGLSAFVYTAIIDSFRPVIFHNFNVSKKDFERQLIRLYGIIIYLSLLQSVVMTLFSGLIIQILYGADYAKASSALRIVVWYTTFSYLGSVRNIWILANNKQKFLPIINFSGAVLNVILNFIMIPMMGIMGAAIASLATQVFANFILGFIIKPIRENNYIMLKSLNIRYLVDMIKS